MANPLNKISQIYLDQVAKINSDPELAKKEREKWQSEAKVDTGSAEEKATARNKRNTPAGQDKDTDLKTFITRKPGESLGSARARVRRKQHDKQQAATRLAKSKERATGSLKKYDSDGDGVIDANDSHPYKSALAQHIVGGAPIEEWNTTPSHTLNVSKLQDHSEFLTSMVWGDLDNDGDADLLYPTGDGRNRQFKNDGN